MSQASGSRDEESIEVDTYSVLCHDTGLFGVDQMILLYHSYDHGHDECRRPFFNYPRNLSCSYFRGLSVKERNPENFVATVAAVIIPAYQHLINTSTLNVAS